tara:strand:- start:72 stop:368 length:297 start_codon:yes stop_codon:yes gene_type:complete
VIEKLTGAVAAFEGVMTTLVALPEAPTTSIGQVRAYTLMTVTPASGTTESAGLTVTAEEVLDTTMVSSDPIVIFRPTVADPSRGEVVAMTVVVLTVVA